MIRPIQPADWPSIDAIQRRCFPPGAIETTESLRSIAEAAPDFCRVDEESGVRPYLLAHPWRVDDLPPLNKPLADCPADSACLFVHDLAIHPSARGTGLASEMVHRLLESAARRGLTSASLLSVQGTVNFWSRFGFVERPELTDRFRELVYSFCEIDFHFMTSALS